MNGAAMSEGPNHFVCSWEEAQRIANYYRRRGIRVHVCQLHPLEHVLWFAR